MCGPDTCTKPRGGALVALSPFYSSSASRPSLSGDLTFHTPGSPESVQATHARLVSQLNDINQDLSELSVIIHASGDLTKSAQECGRFREFSFSNSSYSHATGTLELSLDEPLSLGVGGDGIIGRRVSIYSGAASNQQTVIAEGIVGFNIGPSRASL